MVLGTTGTDGACMTVGEDDDNGGDGGGGVTLRPELPPKPDNLDRSDGPYLPLFRDVEEEAK